MWAAYSTLISLKEFWIGMAIFIAILGVGFAFAAEYPHMHWVPFVLALVDGALFGRIVGKGLRRVSRKH